MPWSTSVHGVHFVACSDSFKWLDCLVRFFWESEMSWTVWMHYASVVLYKELLSGQKTGAVGHIWQFRVERQIAAHLKNFNQIGPCRSDIFLNGLLLEDCCLQEVLKKCLIAMSDKLFREPLPAFSECWEAPSLLGWYIKISGWHLGLMASNTSGWSTIPCKNIL